MRPGFEVHQTILPPEAAVPAARAATIVAAADRACRSAEVQVARLKVMPSVVHLLRPGNHGMNSTQRESAPSTAPVVAANVVHLTQRAAQSEQPPASSTDHPHPTGTLATVSNIAEARRQVAEHAQPASESGVKPVVIDEVTGELRNAA